MLDRIVWTSADGDSISFERLTTSAFLFDETKGIQFYPRQDITQQSPFQQGDTLLRSQGKPRLITFDVHVRELPDNSLFDDMETLREDFAVALSPVNAAEQKNQGVLAFDYSSKPTRYISAQPLEHVPGPRRWDNYQRWSLRFESHDPYFRSVSGPDDLEHSESLPEGTPTTISLAGHVQVLPVVKIVGPCNTPRITNQRTGKYIELTDFDLASGHRLEIDFRVGKKTIYDVTIADSSQVSVFEYLIDPATEFWPLLLGDNDILFESADDGGTATIYWTEKFLAIG